MNKKLLKLSFYLLAGVLMSYSLVSNAYSQSHLRVYTAGEPVTLQPCKPLTQSIVLMGGGKDVRAAYPWMVKKAANCGHANSSHPGNFVVLRSEGNGNYDKTLLQLGAIAAVQTLIVPDSASANDPKLDEYIKNASIIWIAGGDQKVYYDAWKASHLLTLIKNQIHYRHVPFGGASAGMMLLGNFIHTGNPAHILTSTEALANPYNPYMVLQRKFWPSTKNVIEDAPYPIFLNTIIESHFDTRDRMGRTLTFMARNLADQWVGPNPTNVKTYRRAHAIAVDGEAALLIEQKESDHSFQASIVINSGVTGSAYFLNANSYPVCDKTGELLDRECTGTFSFKGVRVSRLTGTDQQSLNLFNLSKWKPTSAVTPENFERYVIDVKSGQLRQSGNEGAVY